MPSEFQLGVLSTAAIVALVVLLRDGPSHFERLIRGGALGETVHCVM
jgi:hypothetical protein